MNNFKGVLVLLGVIAWLCAPFNYASAEDQVSNQLSQDEFNNLQSQGIYGEDVTFEGINGILKEEAAEKAILDAEPVDANAEKGIQDIINSSEPLSPNKYQSFVALPGGGGSLAPGDILITTDTSSYGLTGHAGMVLPNGMILHYPSPSAGIKRIYLSQWMASYPDTKIYHENNRTIANEAANWENSHYYLSNKDAGYSVNTSISSYDPTYCSKMVFQAYYYGTGSAKVEYIPPSHIIPPYLLISYFYSSYKPVRVY